MIKSFACKETQALFEGRATRRIPAHLQRVARRKLRMLNRAQAIIDLKEPPGNHLEMLAGDRKGQWSIRINDAYRLCFRWCDGEIEDVEIVNYH